MWELAQGPKDNEKGQNVHKDELGQLKLLPKQDSLESDGR